MIPWYLITLIIIIGCLGLFDWRYKLAFFDHKLQTVTTIVVAVGMFVIWDNLGIDLGIFFYGGSKLVLPLRLFPDFPLEELLFLILLTYSTLIAYRFLSRKKT